MAGERHDGAFVVGAVLGGVAGAVYALFNVPQSGARTRAELAARWHDGAELIAQTVAGLDERVRQLLGGGDELLPVGVDARYNGPLGSPEPDQIDRSDVPPGAVHADERGTQPDAGDGSRPAEEPRLVPV